MDTARGDFDSAENKQTVVRSQKAPTPLPTENADEPFTDLASTTGLDQTAEAADSEPQTTITRRWSAEEWVKVSELRDKLPSILANALDDGSENETSDRPPLAGEVFGVKLRANERNPKASVILHKFIVARNGDINAAADQLTKTIRWRNDFKALQTPEESFPQNIFGNVGFLTGKAKDGSPMTYNLYGGLDNTLVFGDVERFLRWRVGLMEKGLALLDFESIETLAQVHDYSGVSLFGGRDANTKAAAKQASALFSDYYPECLSQKFFINVPSVMTWIFSLFKTILPARTTAKFHVVGQGQETIFRALSQYIDPSELPQLYGGNAVTMLDRNTRHTKIG